LLRNQRRSNEGASSTPRRARIETLERRDVFAAGSLAAVAGPALAADESLPIALEVDTTNRAPAIQPVANQVVLPGNLLQLQIVASDPNDPPRDLAYSVLTGPTGATIDATTGVFRFTPSSDQTALAAQVSIQVSEVGVDPLSSTVSFIVATDPGLLLSLNSTLDPTAQLLETTNQEVANYTSSSAGISLLYGRSLPEPTTSTNVAQTQQQYGIGAPNFAIGPDTGVPQISNEVLNDKTIRVPRPELNNRPMEAPTTRTRSEEHPEAHEASQQTQPAAESEHADGQHSQPSDRHADDPVSMIDLMLEADIAEAKTEAKAAALEAKIAAIVEARQRRIEQGVRLVDRPQRLQAPELLPARID
jgi:hypothetical protein